MIIRPSISQKHTDHLLETWDPLYKVCDAHVKYTTEQTTQHSNSHNFKPQFLSLHNKQIPSNKNPIMTKLIVVFGATGTQGGSVVASILQHPTLSQQFKIRGVTRDPSKPEVLALKDKGVDFVKVCSCSPIS